MSTEHVPGPWRSQGLIVWKNHGARNTVAECPPGEAQIPPGPVETLSRAEAEANARLIAAAPTAPHECADPQCPGDINRRKLEAFDGLFDMNVDLRTALKLCIPWLGRLIADGGHERCAAPQAAVDALAEAEAVLAKAKGAP